MKTAIYMRVSTDKQETKAQLSAMMEYCRQCGYEDPLVYSDTISGSIFERQQFLLMKQAIINKKINRIVTFELSRIGRDITPTLAFFEFTEKYNVQVETPQTGLLQFDTPIAQIMVAFRAFAATQERHDIARRVKNGLAEAKAKGMLLGAPVGNTRKLGKFKTYPPEITKRALRLTKKLSKRDAAKELGISPSKLARILSRAV